MYLLYITYVFEIFQLQKLVIALACTVKSTVVGHADVLYRCVDSNVSGQVDNVVTGQLLAFKSLLVSGQLPLCEAGVAQNFSVPKCLWDHHRYLVGLEARQNAFIILHAVDLGSNSDSESSVEAGRKVRNTILNTIRIVIFLLST